MGVQSREDKRLILVMSVPDEISWLVALRIFCGGGSLYMCHSRRHYPSWVGCKACTTLSKVRLAISARASDLILGWGGDPKYNLIGGQLRTTTKEQQKGRLPCSPCQSQGFIEVSIKVQFTLSTCFEFWG